MNQDYEKITVLLNDIKKTSVTNANNFDKILSGISSKLDVNYADSNIKLLKAFMNELANSLDHKYSKTQEKFENIEKALKAVYESQDSHVKNNDMKTLFDVLSKNINNFYTEARQNKAILSGIETKIGDFSSNKTDKEDIIRTISLLRNDMGNINLSYKNTIDDINSVLKSILSGVKTIDSLKNDDTVKVQVEVILKTLNDIISNLRDMTYKEADIEKILCNVVTTEDLKNTNDIISSIISMTDKIEQKLDNNIKKDDISALSHALLDITERDAIHATKDDIKLLEQKSSELFTQTDDIKQTLSDIAKNVENIPDVEDLEVILKTLYSHIYDLADSIEKININSDLTIITENFSTLKNELKLIQDIVTDCNTAITDRVISSLEALTLTNGDIKKTVQEIIEQFPQKEDIEKILSNTLEINTLIEKTDSITSKIEQIPQDISSLEQETKQIITYLEKLSVSDNINDLKSGMTKLEASLDSLRSKLNDDMIQNYSEVSDKISDLEHSMSEIISREDFNDFTKELKNIIDELNSHNELSRSNSAEKHDEIIKQLEKIDFTNVLNLLDRNFANINEKFDGFDNNFSNISDYAEKLLNNQNDISNNIESLSDFVKSNNGLDEEYIKSQLEEIKILIENKKLNNSDIDNKNSDINFIREYLENVKDLLQGSPTSVLYSKIMDIENSLVNNQTHNESAYSEILERINNIKSFDTRSEDNSQFSDVINEINSLKNEISNLGKSFNHDTPEDIVINGNNDVSQIETFLSEKFSQICQDFEKITSGATDKISESFASQTQIIEQKTEAIQKFLTDIELKMSNKNPEFSEKISNAKDSLTDIEQELQLVLTDVTENMSNNAAKIMDELNPIKELLNQIAQNINPENLKNDIRDLNNELISNSDLKDLKHDFDDLYDKLSEKFTDNENNIKDFVLSETDSVLLRFEKLAEYVEITLGNVVPPDENTLKDMRDFISDIDGYTKSLQNFVTDKTNEIKDEIKEQSAEIKSMLTIASNHDDIIEAIENLKIIFKSYKSRSKSKNNNDSSDAETTSFDYESISDLQSEFKKYYKQIEKLTDDNAQITGILQRINERLEKDFKSGKSTDENEITDDLSDNFDFSEDDIFGSNKFDVVQAFDILQNDIKGLKNHIDELNEDKENAKIPAVNNSGMILNINSKLDVVLKDLETVWLKNIQEYLNSGNKSIESKLDSINTKLDVFVADTSSNNDILQDVSDSVSEIEPKISAMFEELNEKISDIASKNLGQEELHNIKSLIVEQKNYIEALKPGEKVEAFKKCLDDLAFEVSSLASYSSADAEKLQDKIKEMKDSLMSAVVNIFDQVSFIEESEDIKDFVEERTDEINKKISEITKQLQQISSPEVNNNYTYTMQDIETDLAKLRLALQNTNNVNLSDITQKLHTITSSVDSLSQDEIKSIKAEITNLKEQTQFLVATSDKSYDALNTGIEDFAQIINKSIVDRVDRLSKMLENSAESDKVIKQALIYMGEWIDSASESINKISANTDEIVRINDMADNIENIKDCINYQIEDIIEKKFKHLNEKLLQSIDNQFIECHSRLKTLEKQILKVENLEEQLYQQQERIDRMEVSIDKLLSVVENLEDPAIARKIDKLDKQISKLGTNIEKLASYVD